MTIIGVSGKIGSGKNYLSEQLIKELNKLGYSTTEASFASSLRNELNRIIKTIKVDTIDGVEPSQIISNIKTIHKMDTTDAEELYNILVEDILRVDGLNAHSRTESIRRALQYLGTDVRRKTDNEYWVKEFHRTVPHADFILVTDVRFPNEADSVVEHKGIMLRLEVSPEIILERIQSRDGLKYSADALNHPSELALDEYDKFDYVISDEYNIDDIVSFIVNHTEGIRETEG